MVPCGVFGTGNTKLLTTCPRCKEFPKILTVGYSNDHSVKLINSTSDTRRKLLTRKWAKNLRFELSLQARELSVIVDRILRDLIPELLVTSQPLVDIKGRDGEDLMPGAAHQDIADELMHLEGKIAVEHRSSGYVWEPFTFSARTKFLDFTNANQIRYELIVEHSRNIPAGFPAGSLGRAISIAPSFLRLGINKFKPSFFSTMFGAWPTVVDSLLIDCSSERLIGEIRSDALPKKDSCPFDGTKIPATLENCLGWNIKGA